VSVYHWQDDDGAWHVGVLAKVMMRGAAEWAGCVRDGVGYDLIRHCHTGELEWVPVEKLLPYPSEPIPEPTK
jgi:putative lipase involved disintegration of autophagic bodies